MLVEFPGALIEKLWKSAEAESPRSFLEQPPRKNNAAMATIDLLKNVRLMSILDSDYFVPQKYKKIARCPAGMQIVLLTHKCR
jgi:hypothetical protein